VAPPPAWTGSCGDRHAPPPPGGGQAELEIPIVLTPLGAIDPSRPTDHPLNWSAAKHRLSQLGFLDASWPVHMRAAILAFQIYKQLRPTGELDAATCRALDEPEPERADPEPTR